MKSSDATKKRNEHKLIIYALCWITVIDYVDDSDRDILMIHKSAH